ncbi:MAG TPA: hypothetical protein VHW01_00970, partial [Polyangiaceae bacterium]|nr:hypothetical protein [Polyangiaceae bacterium]
MGLVDGHALRRVVVRLTGQPIDKRGRPCDANAMPGADRKRQKKLEKSRKKRDLIKKQARKREAQYQGTSLLRLAQSAPFGPAWVSASLDEVEPDQAPPLVTVVVTRRVRGLLVAEIVIVDRTCLGIKNAMLLPLITEEDLLERLDALADGGTEFRACEPLEAQSVVFHALDYARSLGFFAHEDFEVALFEPRPASLSDTPLAKPARPIYISGPDDDVPMVLEHLTRTVGPDNYQF